MDCLRNDDERTIIATVPRITQERLAPRAQAVDESGQFPHENFADLHRAGLMGMAALKEDGRLGCGRHGNILVGSSPLEQFALV